jgi:hypothetical protein
MSHLLGLIHRSAAGEEKEEVEVEQICSMFASHLWHAICQGLQAVLRMIGRTTENREIQDQTVATAKDLLEQCPNALGPVEEAIGREILMDLVSCHGTENRSDASLAWHRNEAAKTLTFLCPAHFSADGRGALHSKRVEPHASKSLSQLHAEGPARLVTFLARATVLHHGN